MYVASGTAAGTGTSTLEFQTASAGATGTVDRAPTTKMVISGTGNVGIGSSNPAAKLDIQGSGGVTLNAGNVGIGTTTPIAMLELAKAGTNDPLLRVGGPNATDNPSIMVQNGGGSAALSMFASGAASAFLSNSAAGDVGLRRTGTGNMLFGTGGIAAALAISSAGNVGIGTANPLALLHARTGTDQNFKVASDYIGIGSGITLGSTNDANTSNYPMGFAASKYIFSSVGNIGIGTTAPTQRLDLGGGNISMGYEIITSATCTSSTTGWASCTATCSAGKQALGGSCGTGCCTRAAECTTVTSTSYTCGIYQTNGAYGFNATVVCANIK